MVEIHREVERKYDVDPSFRLPALDGHGHLAEPATLRLEATYYDTADHRLAAARTTLRRRTGGTDAGWHLKLPAEGGARDEIREPPDGDDVPAPLAALARAATRGAELRPVVRLVTERTVSELVGPTGDTLVEVADDRVTAHVLGPADETTSWREVEVELAAGPPELLEAVERCLRKAGAVPAASGSKLARALGGRVVPPRPPGRKSSAGEVLGAYLREQVDALVAQDPRVRLDRHDSVHRMRVATRRLRSVLAAYRPLFDRTVTEPLRAELRWLGAVLGEARDAEVLHARLRALAESEPDDLLLGPVLARIDADLGGRYREAHGAALEALDSDRYLALLTGLDALTPSGRRKRILRRLDRARARVRKAAAAADAAPPEGRDAALHEVRKAAKRARYAAEAARSARGRPATRRAKRLAKRMKALQGLLGEHHDTVAAREVLRTMGAQAYLAGENGFSFGRLHALEERRGEDLLREYPRLRRAALR
ncbi:MAG TPA: CYTH and CHAD domain-containing protein [Mycobacteriales bacterium]|jgi:CHAD domain-containing protein